LGEEGRAREEEREREREGARVGRRLAVGAPVGTLHSGRSKMRKRRGKDSC